MVTVARMSQAEVARPLWGRAYQRSTLRGCLKRKWPEHLSSGHPGTQSCEDVAGESGRTTMWQGTSEVRLVRMSQAKRPEHLTPGCLGTQTCEDVSGESARTTMGQGTSEVRVVRISHAKLV